MAADAAAGRGVSVRSALRHRAWLEASPLSTLMLVTVGCHFSFGVFFTPLLDELGWSHGSVSSIFSAYMAVYIVGQLIAGWLTDRFPPALVIGVGGLVFASGFAMMAFISAPWQAYVCYGVLMALGFGATYVPAVAVAGAGSSSGAPSGQVLGVMTAGSGMGILVVGLLADQLLHHLAVRSAYLVLGILCAAFTTLVSLWLWRRRWSKLSTNQPFGREEAPCDGTTVGQAVRQARTWALVLANTGLNVAVGAYTVHGVAAALTAGISPVLAAAGLLWAGLGRVAGSLLAGVLAVRGNLAWQWRSYTLAIGGSMALFAWLPGLGTYYASCLLFGIGFGASTVAFPLLVANVYGQARLGGIFGLVNLGYGAGGALGSLVVGRLFDVYGAYWPGFLTVCGIAGLAAFVLTVRRGSSRYPRYDSAEVHNRASRAT